MAIEKENAMSKRRIPPSQRQAQVRIEVAADDLYSAWASAILEWLTTQNILTSSNRLTDIGRGLLREAIHTGWRPTWERTRAAMETFHDSTEPLPDDWWPTIEEVQNNLLRQMVEENQHG